MKKLALLSLFLLFSVRFVFAFTISGTTKCIPNKEYVYMVLGADLGKPLTWSITNGTFVGGSFGPIVKVKWKEGTSGSIDVYGRPYGSTFDSSTSLRVKIEEEFIEPIVTNMNINVTGKLKTYERTSFELTYHSTNDSYSKIVHWVITNPDGNTQSFSGNPTSAVVLCCANSTVTAELKYDRSSKIHTVSKSIYIEPTLLGVSSISGFSSPTIRVGEFVDLVANPVYPGPWGEYIWTITPENSAMQSPDGAHNRVMFYEVGLHHVRCDFRNSCGLGGSVTFLASVVGSYYNVTCDNGTLSINQNVSEINNYQELGVMEKNGNKIEKQTISYSLVNMLSGALVGKGEIYKGGGNIDISKLSKGMYLLKITEPNGNSETHKIAIK